MQKTVAKPFNSVVFEQAFGFPSAYHLPPDRLDR
jgi:hypothetical protein